MALKLKEFCLLLFKPNSSLQIDMEMLRKKESSQLTLAEVLTKLDKTFTRKDTLTKWDATEKHCYLSVVKPMVIWASFTHYCHEIIITATKN